MKSNFLLLEPPSFRDRDSFFRFPRPIPKFADLVNDFWETGRFFLPKPAFPVESALSLVRK
ncbi:MAG: hypothetical protein CBC46_13325 [Verrucomicrobiaceae bacterium TMED86]|nr:MAG: hypothetical protein CBC46_13325 [Verrucomicrobiaceae bacterium TMED86]